MVEKSLEKMSNANLYKLDVGFNIKESSVSTVIGRAAHIKFLESFPLIDMLINHYHDIL